VRPLVSGYNLSPRHLEEMMAERGICVDYSTIHRWVMHFAPMLLELFNQRKRAITSKWHMEETYIKVRGRRRIKRRIRPMFGFNSTTCAATVLAGSEEAAGGIRLQSTPSLAEQFSLLAA
jgi:transposase-like protein